MISWSKKEAKETGNNFYVNWFGKYFLSWVFLNIFASRGEYENFTEEEFQKIGKTLEKSSIVKRLRKQGKTDKEMLDILVKDYKLWQKTGVEFEKTFGVKWPL